MGTLIRDCGYYLKSIITKIIMVTVIVLKAFIIDSSREFVVTVIIIAVIKFIHENF